ncbi:hypothetical protein LEN26_012906 [Aphanomyces euteiches]|nr:hypothetical protein LEN26_012906 [Aphanomyces euteiches]
MATGGWRLEVTEEMRKTMITEMYHELLRISGESDRQKVWQSAAKFELTLWTQSTEKNVYLTKLQKKIATLKKKPNSGKAAQPAVAPAPIQQTQPAAFQTQANNMAY